MSTKNIKTASNVAGKKAITDIQKELGFGELPSSYSPANTSLDIDPALKKELKDAGLVYRFINFNTYKRQGFHKSHWKPYKRQSTPNHGAVFTLDPDGYTVNQDLVLGVRPVEWNEAHKKFLNNKANRLSDPQKIAAEKMKEVVAESGGSVIEGYEDNE